MIKNTCIIGREVCGGSEIVSGKHCEIYLHDLGFFIKDNNSSNKTFFLIGKQGLHFVNGTQHNISFNSCFYSVEAKYKNNNFYLYFKPLRNGMEASKIKLDSEETFITNNHSTFEVSKIAEEDKNKIFASAKIQDRKIKLIPHFDEVLL